MDKTNTEKSSASGFASTAEDYRLWAAQNDPMVRAGSGFLTDKLGLSEEISDLLMLVAQRVMGIQNGGVALAGTMQSAAVGIGMPTYVSSGGYSGTISGNNVMALNFSSKITEAIQSAFFRSNGAARYAAMGMNQGEISGVMSQLMRAGAAHQFGPLGRTEVLTGERIEELRQRARKSGNRQFRQEVEQLQEGQLYTSLNETNMKKFEDYAKKAVRVVSAMKSFFNSSSLEELDSKIQETMGMSLPEFGFDRANALLMKTKAAGITYFGGDMTTAMAYMNAGSDAFALGAAQQLGMDPNDPMVRNAFKGIGATVMSYRGASAIAGGFGQIAKSGRLRGQGFDVATTEAAEIAQQTQEDTGIIATQETELLAVTSMMQKLGAGATADQRSAADAAIRALQSAGTNEEVIAARAQLGVVFNQISGGQSVGEYVGDAANQARLMAGLRGRSKDDFARAAAGARDSRMADLLTEEYANSQYLQQATGFNSDEMGAMGTFIANLTSAQQDTLANGDVAGLMRDSNVKAMMTRMGLNPDQIQGLAGRLDRNKVNMIAAAANQFEGTETFISYGDLQEGAKQQVQDLLRTSLSGPARPTGDAISEFIAGMAGEEELRGGALTKAALAEGKGTSLWMEDGMISGAGWNFKKLMGNAQGKAFLEAAGVTNADQFAEYMKDATNQQELLTNLTKSGAYVVDKGKSGDNQFSFLTEEEESEMRKKMQTDAYARMAKNLGKAPVGVSNEEWEAGLREQFKQKEGESDEEYMTRVRRTISGKFSNYVNSKEGGAYSDLAKTIAEGGEKGEELAGSLMASSEYLTSNQQTKVMEALSAQAQQVEKDWQKANERGITPEEQAEFNKKQDRLKTAMDKVRANMKTQEVAVQHTTTMNVTTMNVNPTPKSGNNKGR